MKRIKRVAAGLLLLLVGLGPARAEVYGLVIGIDDYAYVPDLAGAVHDARDIARALEARGGKVTLLLDRRATRERIMKEFDAIAAQLRSGDTLVLSYAGHGVQLPEALAGDEADGLDETFILHGFEMRGPGFNERIRDNDISEMLSRIPRDVGVLVVADSCHSGTMTRSVDSRGSLGRSRFVAVSGETAEDTLPKPEARTRAFEASDFPNVVFANAARDDQQTPEVQIDGDYRGALSWSVARAFDGDADGGDGSTSLEDFRNYVIEQVSALSGTRQTPGVGFVQGVSSDGLKTVSTLFGNVAGAITADKPDEPVEKIVLADPPSLFVREGGVQTRAALLAGMRLAESEETARLMWDREYEELVDRATADVISQARSEADVANAVLKWRAVQPLGKWAPKRPLEFRLDPDDRRYSIGDKLHIVVSQPEPKFSYLTIINLASTGEVQFIYPSAGHVNIDHDRIDDATGEKRLGPAPVIAPTGADHVIALASTERLSALHAELELLHGTRSVERLLNLLETQAADATRVRVGLLPIFTEP